MDTEERLPAKYRFWIQLSEHFKVTLSKFSNMTLRMFWLCIFSKSKLVSLSLSSGIVLRMFQKYCEYPWSFQNSGAKMGDLIIVFEWGLFLAWGTLFFSACPLKLIDQSIKLKAKEGNVDIQRLFITQPSQKQRWYASKC